LNLTPQIILNGYSVYLQPIKVHVKALIPKGFMILFVQMLNGSEKMVVMRPSFDQFEHSQQLLLIILVLPPLLLTTDSVQIMNFLLQQ